MDERRGGTTGDHPAVEVHRPLQVRGESLIDRRVERDRGRGVAGDVDAAGDLRHATSEVRVDHVHAFVKYLDQLLLAHPFAQRVERRLAQQVLDPLSAGGARLRAHQQDDAGLVEVGHQSFEHDLRQESGDTRQQDRLAGQRLHDRGIAGSGLRPVLYHVADYALSTTW